MRLNELALKIDNLLGISPDVRYKFITPELLQKLFAADSVEVKGVRYVGEHEVVAVSDYEKGSVYSVYLRFSPVAFPNNIPSLWLADYSVEKNARNLESLLNELKQYNNKQTS